MKIEPLYLPGNHAKGRKGHRPEAIVIHLSEGTLDSMTTWFRNPDAKVSAHYAVARSGRVLQYVRDEDTAWANGRVLRPTAEMVRERDGINPNLWTLSIEHEGTITQEPTEAQLAASAELVRLLAARHGIPITRRHVIGHREIYAAKACPGPIDVDELVERARLPDVAELPLVAEVIPPNLERIILPTRAHFEAAAKVRGLDFEAVMQGVEVVEAILRIMVKSGVKQVKPAADVLAEVLKEVA